MFFSLSKYIFPHLSAERLFSHALKCHSCRLPDGLSDGRTALYLRLAVEKKSSLYEKFPSQPKLIGPAARYHLAFAKTAKKQDGKKKLIERLEILVKTYNKEIVIAELEKDKLLSHMEREQIKNALFPKPVANEKTRLLPKPRPG